MSDKRTLDVASLSFYCGRCGRISKDQTKQEEVDETCITFCANCGDEVAGPVPAGEYTPGPWGVNPDGDTIVATHNVIDTVVANTVGRAIDAAFFGQTYEEQKANVRLIAAAPELLDAAKAALDVLDTISAGDRRKMYALHLLRNVINKVDGR